MQCRYPPEWGEYRDRHANVTKNKRVVNAVKCCVCGTDYEPHAGRGRPSKYCSPACRKQAQRLRDKLGARPAATRKEQLDRAGHEDGVGEACEYSGDDIPANRRHDFDRLAARKLDDDRETVLRRSQRKLQQVIDDPDTPKAAIAKLVETLIDVTAKLEAVKDEDGGGDDLLDLFANNQEEAEHDDTIGAEIV